MFLYNINTFFQGYKRIMFLIVIGELYIEVQIFVQFLIMH